MHDMQIWGGFMTMDWNPTSRTSFGVSEDALDELDEIADEEGMNRSEKLRQLVRQEVERKRDIGEKNLDLPRDDRLADAYQQLHDRAYDSHKRKPRLPLKTAKNDLYSNEVAKDDVLRKIIKPLEARGYVKIYSGFHHMWITVRNIQQKSRKKVEA